MLAQVQADNCSHVFIPPPPDLHPPRNRDFVRLYAKYADLLEVPKVMHEAVAMQLIASLLNRNGVVIPWGAVTYTLDLWIVLLSGSGAGRNIVHGWMPAAAVFFKDINPHPWLKLKKEA